MDSQRFWLVGLCGLLVAASQAPGAAPSPPADAQTTSKATAGDVRALKDRIDLLVAEKWAEAKVKPAEPADDAEFLRRVSLDLTGKIPTAAEVRAFLDDPAPDKRTRLVDRLLESP